MKNKKTLGYGLLVVGSALGVISLMFSPIAMIGIYFLLGEFKSGMGNIVKIIISVVGGVAIPLLLATIVSFLFY